MNILLAGITITILIASVQSFGYDNRASLVKKWDYEVLGPDVKFLIQIAVLVFGFKL